MIYQYIVKLALYHTPTVLQHGALPVQ